MNHWLQKLIPQHLLSRWFGRFAEARLGLLTRFVIKRFIMWYQVDMSDAKITDYRQFKSFNDFFTRTLKQGARPLICDNSTLLSPVDGRLSELGYITQDQLLQAKGVYFSLLALLGANAVLADVFKHGAFFTAYLAPNNYHRIHMPFSGRLTDMIYVPGSLFSVSLRSVNRIPNLFTRNERVICIFDTVMGKIAVIAVGAMIVGSIVTKWHGVVTSSQTRVVTHWNYMNKNIRLEQGDELGYFQLGSTVIILCEKNRVKWQSALQVDNTLKVGEVIGSVTNYSL